SLPAVPTSPPYRPSSPTRRSSDLRFIPPREQHSRGLRARGRTPPDVCGHHAREGTSLPHLGTEPHAARPDSLCHAFAVPGRDSRSEEHTSELQSRENLVCRLLLEK